MRCEQTVLRVDDADDLAPELLCGMLSHGPNHSVEARTVAPAGENPKFANRCHVQLLPTRHRLI